MPIVLVPCGYLFPFQGGLLGGWSYLFPHSVCPVERANTMFLLCHVEDIRGRGVLSWSGVGHLLWGPQYLLLIVRDLVVSDAPVCRCKGNVFNATITIICHFYYSPLLDY